MSLVIFALTMNLMITYSFNVFFAKSIWFYMGKCPDQFYQWQSMEDVIQFALTLDKPNRTALLIVASAVI